MFDEPKRMTMMDERLMRLGDGPRLTLPPTKPAPYPVPTGFDAAALNVVCAPTPVQEPALSADPR